MDPLAADAMPTISNGRSFADLDQAERDRLGALLRPLPWIDGLITAVTIAPSSNEDDEVEGALDWLGAVWDEDKEDRASELTARQGIEVALPVMDHYLHVAAALEDEPRAYSPYLAGYADPLEAAAQWAAGFCGGIALEEEAWAPLFADEEAMGPLVALLSLMRDEDLPEDMRRDSPFHDMPPDEREEMRRAAVAALPQIVLTLYDRAIRLSEGDGLDADDEPLEGSEDTYVRAVPKVGRNEPCPCGSGKKYKKCCLE